MLHGECVKQGGKAVDDVSDIDVSDDESSVKEKDEHEEEKEAETKENGDLEEAMLEEMREAMEDADSEELLRNGVRRPSDTTNGVRTGSQRAKGLNHVAGGEHLKRQSRELCQEADSATGRKEVGHGARSMFSDDGLLWGHCNTVDGNFWEQCHVKLKR